MWYVAPHFRHKILCPGPVIRRILSGSDPICSGDLMSQAELLVLLSRARAVLDRYLFDESETMRDDVAQVCTAIDEALPDEGGVEVNTAELERPSQRSAA